jgi:hypothetical protein
VTTKESSTPSATDATPPTTATPRPRKPRAATPRAAKPKAAKAAAEPQAAKPRRAAAPRARRGRALVTAPPEKCFWVHYGPVLKDLRELRDALEHQVSEAQFAHHVGPERNDFANWVDHVLAEKACARALRRARTVSEALSAIETALLNR